MADAEETKPYKANPNIPADENTVLEIHHGYRQESREARLTRMEMNKVNFDAYHGRQDFSYKEAGQSQEFLPKVFIAVEQNASTVQQSLVDWDWFKVYPSPGQKEDSMKIKPQEIQDILVWQLRGTNFMTKMGDFMKLGLLGSLMIGKIHGTFKPKMSYKTFTESQKDGSYKKKLVKAVDQKWQLVIDTVRQEDWYPDPTGAGLYFEQDTYIDYHSLVKLAEQKGSGYNMERIKELRSMGSQGGFMQEYNKSRETGQNLHNAGFRNRIKLTEIWGDFVTPQGDLIWENCTAVVANDLFVVKKPTPIGFWHGEHPYVTRAVISVPNSQWGKTPVDAGAELNLAANELFNLILDGGLMAVHGIKQIREHWLEDPSQIEDGISSGDTLRVNTSCPPGAVALERVDTTTIPPEALPVYNFLVQEFTSAMMTNDLRMQGGQSGKDVKATAIVEASNAENAMSRSIAMNIEADFLKPMLMKAWLTIAQHLSDLDQKELGAIIGDDRAAALMNMGPEDLFAETASSIKFEVFGISERMSKQKDFTKLQAMLQTVASSPVLMENFTQKYDFGKLLQEIMKSLDIPLYRLEHDEDQSEPMPQGAAPQVPNAQSQIPQAGSAQNQAAETMQSQAQPGPPGQQAFPASRALAAEGR